MYRKSLFTIMIAALLVFSTTAFLFAAAEDQSKSGAAAGSWQSSSQRGSGKSMLLTANDLMDSDVISGTPGAGSSAMGTRDRTMSSADQNDPNRMRQQNQQAQQQRGETLGSVEELIVDDNKDKVHYVLLSVDDKYYPVPMSAFDCAPSHSGMRSTGTDTRTGMGAGGVGGTPGSGTTAGTGAGTGSATGTARDTQTGAAGSTAGTGTTGAGTGATGSRTGTAAGTSADRDRQVTLYLNISKDKLKQAPSVDSDNVSAFDDTNLQQRIDSFYAQNIPGKSDAMMRSQKQTGTQAGTQQQQLGSQQGQAKHIKASEIIGLDVKDNADKDLGEIEDLVIDSRQGHLAYGLVSFGGFMDIGDKTAAVPWQALNINMQEKVAKVNASDAQLKAAVVEKDNIQRLSQPEFARQIHSTFNTQPYWEVYGFEPGDEAGKSMDADKPKMDDQQKKMDDQQKQKPNY